MSLWNRIRLLFGWQPSVEEILEKHDGPVIVVTPKPKPAESPKPYPLVRGLDVSHFQERVDWNQARRLGYSFAFAKATDGEMGKDSMFDIHKKEAKAAGFIFGAYHFFRFEQDPVKQMKHFMSVAGTVEPGELPHTIDAEWDRTSKKYGEGKAMDEEAADNLFMAANILGLSIKMMPIIYTNYYFWHPGKWSETWKQCHAWIPAYHTTMDKVKVPPPWEKLTFWQSADNLSLGNVKAIDGNVFNGSMVELEAMTKK